jgi:hypothetical protein
LKIAVGQDIAVNQKQPTYASTRKEIGLMAAKGSTTQDGDARLCELGLPFMADLWIPDLSGITFPRR